MAAPDSSNPYAPPQVVETLVRSGWISPPAYVRGLMIATAASMVATFATRLWYWADYHERTPYIFVFPACQFLSATVNAAATFTMWFLLGVWPVSLVFWWWRKPR